ncbi:VOC family protein [Alicyclobacillus sp. ALC3]|uniref:VOC family protein n=1 Tax=Alicyclobacillus sp. ALC3 TaxID=2796143 RepID=UPI002378BA8D|nr:VOC family protein [Alicyclobacillus sp. ALC3]WDL97623.1 VOC family protein [Alicyclobacillus sp. ALC3]
MPIEIERANHINLRVTDPEEAAEFAVAKMGFSLAHQNAGQFYLQAGGFDPYSLVYTQGDPSVDHISYLVKDRSALLLAEDSLRRQGVPILTETSPSDDWKHGEAMRFLAPGNTIVELAVGVHVDKPVGALVQAPVRCPGPISFDHAVSRVLDVDEAYKFWTRIIGFKESATIRDPEAGPVLTFFRCKTLFHCYAVARSNRLGLHHFQMTLKDPVSLWEAADALKQSGVELVWGPVRHGPGHNIAFYFHDYAGNTVEYSCEEEIILHDETYRPRQWSTTDQKSLDEWGSLPPEGFL